MSARATTLSYPIVLAVLVAPVLSGGRSDTRVCGDGVEHPDEVCGDCNRDDGD